jgi:class 3 adenylate cyclase
MSRFYELLDDYNGAATEAEQAAAEDALWRDFGSERAVLMLDMSGFSLLTQRHGIVHYLSMILHMRHATRPVIESVGGQVVKYEADNCYAHFPAVESAVRAAIDINRVIAQENADTDSARDIHVCIGIDFGRVLVVEGGVDFFGDPVNLACKLGEDVAAPGEILVTEQAMAHLDDASGLRSESGDYSVSGIHITAHRIVY